VIILFISVRLIRTFSSKQDMFAAQGLWWPSQLIGLSPTLVVYWKHKSFPAQLVVQYDSHHQSEFLSLGAFGRCRTRMPWWSNPTVYWTDAVTFRCTSKHLKALYTILGSLTTSLGALATRLGAPRITVE